MKLHQNLQYVAIDISAAKKYSLYNHYDNFKNLSTTDWFCVSCKKMRELCIKRKNQCPPTKTLR